MVLSCDKKYKGSKTAVCSSVGGLQLTETPWPGTAFLSWYLRWALKHEQDLRGAASRWEREQVQMQRRRAGGEAHVAGAQVEKGGWPNMSVEAPGHLKPSRS